LKWKLLRWNLWHPLKRFLQRRKRADVVDIGGGTTDIAIFKDNIIRHTYYPYGGGIITEDIKEGCSTSLRNMRNN
jgi:cell division ATPase FtsA